MSWDNHNHHRVTATTAINLIVARWWTVSSEVGWSWSSSNKCHSDINKTTHKHIININLLIFYSDVNRIFVTILKHPDTHKHIWLDVDDDDCATSAQEQRHRMFCLAISYALFQIASYLFKGSAWQLKSMCTTENIIFALIKCVCSMSLMSNSLT